MFTFPQYYHGMIILRSIDPEEDTCRRNLGYCAAGLYPIIVYSVANIIVDPILVTFGQICNFRDPNLVTFYFYELTHFLD